MNEDIINSLIGDLLKKSGASDSNEKQHNDNYDGLTFTVNGVSFEMITVEGGTFTMGATSEQGSDAYSNEKPTHQVTLSSYSIGQTEVTQALWKVVMGSNPSYDKGDNLPVEGVSWNDCQEFIRRLNQLTGEHFRLPTEAEWEYAARGGNKSRRYQYAGSDSLDKVAWYCDSKPYPVKTKSPNELGLYDMSGNVWEWCSDWFGNYSSGSQTDPTGPASGSYRVSRGGCWDSHSRSCRVSSRNYGTPDCEDFVGLRLVLSEIGDLHNISGASDSSSNQPDKEPYLNISSGTSSKTTSETANSQPHNGMEKEEKNTELIWVFVVLAAVIAFVVIFAIKNKEDSYTKEEAVDTVIAEDFIEIEEEPVVDESKQTQLTNYDDIKSVIVTGTNVRLRLTPSIQPDNILTDYYGNNIYPDKGDYLVYIGETDEFYRVKYQDYIVWISKQFTTPSIEEIQ